MQATPPTPDATLRVQDAAQRLGVVGMAVLRFIDRGVSIAGETMRLQAVRVKARYRLSGG